MVEPIGYDSMWQKFENDVYNTVKRYLEIDNKFKVEWIRQIRGLKPDVLASLQCSGCEYQKDEEPCLIPSFIFDAYCKFKIEETYFEKKDEQMEKYAKICDAILVMPQGYEQRPFCKSKSGNYHIVSFHHLPTFLESIKEAVAIKTHEDVCGDRPECDAANVYKHFELSIRSRVDKCPSCSNKISPISLIRCDKYDEYYYPDFLDYEVIEHGIGDFTHAECDSCAEVRMSGWNYDECAYSSIEFKYQCVKCGAIFDPETKKIVSNFEDAHSDMIKESFPYYQNV